jgi:hypothetical protein
VGRAAARRAHAREKKQRSQPAAAQFNRLRSALTQQVRWVVSRNLNRPAALPAVESGSKWSIAVSRLKALPSPGRGCDGPQRIVMFLAFFAGMA